jgi:hypothetical protein
MLNGIELKAGMNLRAKKDDAMGEIRIFKKGDTRIIKEIDVSASRIYFTNGNFCGIGFANENYEVVQEPTPMNRPEAWLWLLGQKEGAMCKNNNDYIKLTDNDLRFCDNTGKILDVCLAIMSKSEQWLPYTPPQEITLQEAMDIWKNEGRVMVVGQRFSVVYSYFDYIECQSLHDAKFYKVEGER